LPRVSWAGRAFPAHLSLAHTSGFSVACFDVTAIGLDLEVPMPRNPAFYRVNFSAAERRWVEGLSGSGRVDAERVYTLLWCLKESALKLCQTDEISVWRIPSIEIKIHAALEVLLDVFCGTSLKRPLRTVHAELCTGGDTNCAEAAVATTPDAVLTVLRKSEGGWG